MKLLEALIQVRDNAKTITHSAGCRVKSLDGRLLFKMGDFGDEWSGITDLLNYQQFQDDWEIYEEPEEISYYSLNIILHNREQSEKALGDKINQGEFISCLHSKIVAKTDKEAKAWSKALETFFELKSHPLACASVREKIQYHIVPYSIDALDIEDSYFLCSKTSLLSPSFETTNDALTVMGDMGIDRLLHMFRTFQGIYE